MANQIINFDDFADDKVTIEGKNYKPRKTKVLTSEETSKKKFIPKQKSVKKTFRTDENDTDTDVVSVEDLNNKYKKELEKIGLKDKLAADAKQVLSYQLKKLPQYKIIEQQITLLTEELKAYRKTGDENKINECIRLIEDLGQNKKRLVQVFKNKKQKTNKSPEEIKEAYKNSPELTSLVDRKKELQALIKSTSASYYITKLKDLQEQVKLNSEHSTEDSYTEEIIDLDNLENVEDLDIDDLDIDSKISVKQKYENYCGTIGDLLGYSALEISEMKISEIRRLLKEKYEDENKSYSDELNKINADISIEKSKIRGDLELTNVLFEVFDFKNEETITDPVVKLKNDKLRVEISDIQTEIDSLKQRYEDSDINKENKDLLRSKINELTFEANKLLSQIQDEVIESSDVKAAKEILAAANINLVSAIAYKQCEKIGQLHNLSDAISYGLLSLSKSINNWFKMQKLVDSALSFNSWANMSISNDIQKGLYELTGGGQASGTTIATLVHKQQKRIAMFIENNPEFEDMDKSMINDLLNSEGTPTYNTISATDYTAMVGGEDGSDSADIFANTAVDAGGAMDASYEDAREQWAHLVKGIKTLFSMFRTKKDSEGNFHKTNKKLFDKYDRKLFILYFGLGYDKDLMVLNDSNKVKKYYSNNEIAEKLTKYAQEECGETTKTFTASALFAKKDGRLTLLLERLKLVMDNNSEIKMAFEYLLNFRKFEALDDTWNVDYNMDEALYSGSISGQNYLGSESNQDMFSQYMQEEYYK